VLLAAPRCMASTVYPSDVVRLPPPSVSHRSDERNAVNVTHVAIVQKAAARRYLSHRLGRFAEVSCDTIGSRESSPGVPALKVRSSESACQGRWRFGVQQPPA
jgi:hypothetical protein